MFKTVILGAIASVAVSGAASALPLLANGNLDDTTAGSYFSNGAGGSAKNVDIADLGQSGKPKWAVFDEIMGWTGTGNGIEVQSSGTVVNADTPSYYVELDSHGRNSNSGMYQDVFLAAGDYTLEFMYRARTNDANTDPTLNTNGIEVSVTGLGGALAPSDFLTGIAATSKSDWQKLSFDFTVGSEGTVRVMFEALGKPETYGGFIDSVDLFGQPVSAVPLPAGVWLMGSAMAGIGLARRRRKSN